MTRYRFLWGLTAVLITINLLLGAAYIIRPNQFTSDSGVLGAQDGVPEFSPGFVMSNETFATTRAFPTEQSVQAYLDQANSPLRGYRDQGRLASYWIYNAARGGTSARYGITPQLNPGVLMGYLEKEQSLISIRNYDMVADPQNRLRTAMGYGCPDYAKCDTQYYGLANQLNWAAFQLQYNFNLAGNPNSGTPYRKSATITTLDEYDVLLSNEATAAQYRYTPHVYWGNYNLWKILTANGWNASGTRYSMRDIDQRNLYEKKVDPDGLNEVINASDIANILNASYEIGQQSKDIETLQKFLRQEGYYTYAFITGYYGAITKSAHDAFKAAGGVAASTPAPEPEPVGNCDALYARSWSIGQQGDEVRQLQECLRTAGTFTYATSTGYYGPITEKALRDYQAQNAPAPAPTPQPEPAPEPTPEPARQPEPQPEASANRTETERLVVLNCDELRTREWRIGQVSEDVRQLQACMRSRDFFTYAGGNTGYFGPVTQEALTKWREAVKPKDRCEELKQKEWKFGVRSAEVRELQQCMKDKGFFDWPYITDYFGPVTNEALNEWRDKEPPIFTCSALKEQEWRRGEVSERVRQLQACMRGAGTFTWSGGNTGYFGSVTEKALVAWRGYF